MRDLSKTFSEKELRWIISQLQDIDLSDYDEVVFDEVEDVVKYVGAHDLHWDELGFFIKLVDMNPDYETEPIKVPELKVLDVEIGVDLTEYIYEKWSHKVKTYLDEDDESMILDQMADTSYWEGTLLDKNEYSSDLNEEKIERITRLKR